jgi:hypothetical protein
MPARITGFGCGLIRYLIFFAKFIYAIGFAGDLIVPISIDSGPQGPLASNNHPTSQILIQGVSLCAS